MTMVRPISRAEAAQTAQLNQYQKLLILPFGLGKVRAYVN